MRPLRFALNVAALVVAPAAIAGTLAFVAIDSLARHVQRTHPQLDADIASEIASWLATQGDPA